MDNGSSIDLKDVVVFGKWDRDGEGDFLPYHRRETP